MDFKLYNKIFVITLFLTICFVFFISIQSIAKAETCHTIGGKIAIDTGDSTPVSVNGGASYDGDSCSREPKLYKVKFYKVLLCISDPFVVGSGDTGADPDYTGCITEIFSSAAGKDIEIEPGKKSDLLETGFELPIGSYTHAFLVVSNHLGIKHFEELVDDNGAAFTATKGYNTSAGTPSTGSICWSVDGKATTYTNTTAGTHNSVAFTKPLTNDFRTLTLACGSTLGATHDYGYAFEIIDSIDSTCDASNDCDSTFRPYTDYETEDNLDGSFAAVLLQSNGTSVGSNRGNSVKLGYILRFNTPLEVTEDVTSFEMQFTTKTSVSVDFHDAATQAKKVGADPFGVKFVLGTER